MMNNFIFANYWGDSAGYISNINNLEVESLTTLLAVIFRPYLSGITIFNIQILLAFISTFLITYYVGKNSYKTPIAALFLATVITFAPLRIRYSMEWAVLSYWGYFVLLFYSIIKYYETHQKKYLILAGIGFGLSFLEQPYLGVILTFSTGLTILILNILKRKLNFLKKSIIIGLTLTIFGLPGIYNVYRPRDIGDLHKNVNYSMAARPESDRWAFSAKPWNYLIPDINNPFLGDFAVQANYWIWNHPPYYLTEPYFPKEHTLYLGYSLILLSLVTLYLTFIKKITYLKKTKLRILFFLILGIIATVFSFPPYIVVKGLYIYFPSHYLYEFIPQFRAYTRFGAITFLSVAFIATEYFSYMIQSDLKRSYKIVISTTIVLLVLIEFANPYFSNSISALPTTPYQWLYKQPGPFTYIEIPKRTDYTDQLYDYVNNTNIKSLNPYLNTSQVVEEIEQNIVSNIGDSKFLLCQRFKKDLNGKYIIYHNKANIKEDIVNEFIKTNVITPELKIAMEETWGEPVWGNHVPKSTEDIQKENKRRNLLEKLKNDKRFVEIRNFNLRDQQMNKYTALNLDEITIFKLNEDYCE